MSTRHQALAEALFADIASGRLAVGDRLPTEHQLCATHGMARGTARRALARLEELGMIRRTPGRGTTVIAPGPVAAYQPVARSAADIASLASDTRLVAARSRELTLRGVAADRIGVPSGSRWFLIEGVRTTRADPDTALCWSEQYLRHDLPRDKFRAGRFSLDDLAGQAITQIVTAALLDDEVAAALSATAGGPALVILRAHRDRADRLIHVGVHTHPADRFHITTHLSDSSPI